MDLKRFKALAKKWLRRIGYTAVILVAVVGVALIKVSDYHPSLRLSDMHDMVVKREISQAEIRADDKLVIVTFKSDNSQHEVHYPSSEYDPHLVELFEGNGVAVKAVPKSFLGKVAGSVLGYVPVIAILAIFAWRKVWAKKRTSDQVLVPPKERFADVGANEEVIERLRLMLDDIRNPASFKKRGLKPSKGILLFGPSGTGKTLMARAVAGEAGLPFFSTSGSDLTSSYRGESAWKLRALFKRAEAAAKRNGTLAIVFIDEIDTIGSERTSRTDSVSRDNNGTLNQLLTCLDGFSDSKVIVIAATNRKSTLDAALLRPGRLSLELLVPLPDHAGRIKILQLYIKRFANMSVTDPQLERLADMTGGMSGAGIADLVNEAGRESLHRTKSEKDATVSWDDFREAMLNVRFGPERKLDGSEELLEANSLREARRAIVGLALPELKPYLINTTPRSGRSGVTLIAEHPEGHPCSIEQFCQRLCFMMAGRAAEKILLNGYTTATTDDLKEATKLAFKIVCEMGYNRMVSHAVDMERWQSDPQAGELVYAVNGLLEKAEERATMIIESHADKAEVLTKLLLDNNGLLEADDLEEFVVTEPARADTHVVGYVK